MTTPLTDACPRCWARGNTPLYVDRSARTLTALYRCPHCLWSWNCHWHPDTTTTHPTDPPTKGTP